MPESCCAAASCFRRLRTSHTAFFCIPGRGQAPLRTALHGGPAPFIPNSEERRGQFRLRETGKRDCPPLRVVS